MKPTSDLPQILDYPESPLPAWKHYGITNFAGQQIQAELKRTGYAGYLIGLGVSYTLAAKSKIPYVMVFGKVDSGEDPAFTLPLNDDFLVGLHETVEEFIGQNIQAPASEIDIELIITLSGSVTKVIIACRLVGPTECAQGDSGTKKKCKSLDNGTSWNCLHTPCRR